MTIFFIDAKTIPLGKNLHAIFVHDVVYCGSQCNAWKGKSHYKCDHNISHKQCSFMQPSCAILGIWCNLFENYHVQHNTTRQTSHLKIWVCIVLHKDDTTKRLCGKQKLIVF